MSVWRPTDVTIEPATQLLQWRVYKVEGDFRGAGDTIHFVGRTAYMEGRVSSPIQTFDKETMIGVSRSGRRYHLTGVSGHNSDATYTFNSWVAMNGDPKVTDITNQYGESNEQL